MLCKVCGKKISDNSDFCDKCFHIGNKEVIRVQEQEEFQKYMEGYYD